MKSRRPIRPFLNSITDNNEGQLDTQELRDQITKEVLEILRNEQGKKQQNSYLIVRIISLCIFGGCIVIDSFTEVKFELPLYAIIILPIIIAAPQERAIEFISSFTKQFFNNKK